jgi:ferredoxin-NADP reductase/MOSC domain-containing protein YiiM
MATLVSVNVGMPQDVSWRGRTVHTGVWKRPVSGPALVRRLNVDGDGQGDLAGHGGEQRAVLVYQLGSYRHWEEVFGKGTLEPGVFGENFTVDGLADDEACIGDRYRIGDAEFEVSQPRVTCFRVGMRLGEPELPSLLVAHRRPGFYLRVITEGQVQAGDEVVRTRRGRHGMSVAEVDALLYLPDHGRDRLELAADLPALSPGWQESFRDMLARPGASGLEPGQEPAAWPGFRRLTVTSVVAESASVVSVNLSGDGPLPRPRPGQYLTLRVPGAGDPVPVRSYSLSGDPGQEPYRISVKREPHGVVSGYLQDHLRPGSVVEVAAPRGDFTLDSGTQPVVLVSAGIGVTPVLAMLHQLSVQHSPREVWWLHTAHDAASHAFLDETAELVRSLPAAHSVVHYTAPATPPAAGSAIRAGRLTAAAIADLGLPQEATAYVCGPGAFMDDVTQALLGAGLAPERVHTERFGSRSPVNPGIVGEALPAPHEPPGERGVGPAIAFARSGLTVAWSDAYSSVLELAEACDVPTRWSCRTGVCHTCATSLMSGEAAYTTAPLEPPGTGQVLICCAVPAEDLVLDL